MSSISNHVSQLTQFVTVTNFVIVFITVIVMLTGIKQATVLAGHSRSILEVQYLKRSPMQCRSIECRNTC
eukprot:24444-Amphidinium_carterae.1